jgi:lysophospholipase L1-like esterase
MKKILGIVTVFIIGLSVIGCNNGTTDNADEDVVVEDVIVCLGNSLTAGYGAATPTIVDETKSYPAYLQAKVKNMLVVNAGVSGHTSGLTLARVNHDVLSWNPKIVILEIGGNDIFQGVPFSETEKNIKDIIRKIDNGKRKIFVAKFYTEEIARSLINGVGITDYDLQTAFIARYDALFNSLPSANVELIEDIWDGVWGIHMSDEVHPDAAGYAIMAENYYKAMKPSLGW